ncbi:hypothetical protein MDOR_34990 [Mycolicibacterium doricum]|uniref:XRE family transcriptional regulator n=1 Tax=Mycolicibacterium doricum TaxID=126673 RepID=A0A1X1T2J0_9MYCO|nr:hypothetical protein [Mycolicibacterium doricum]MCV7270109.1 hypothetical protein [Mycolicibacterium doricum]ORV38478.1 XRE family transcriptional regulator [Mycolicibacterium doricum]BBZ09330.1 hypothetical protein MDOR_34990 [Mycolicibacterium doricum]
MTDIAAYERQVMRAVNTRLHAHLARAGEANIDPEVFGDPDDLAEAMVAALPHSHVFDEIAGPFYDTAGLTRWLGITRQALHQRAAKNAILACPLADGSTVYPAWQFLPDGATLPSLAEVLGILGDGDDPWMVALWLRAPSALLDGERPSDWLRDGGDPQPVLAMARDTAEGWRR